MDYFGQLNINHDIVLSKGLRFNHQINKLVIQKPREVDGGIGKITILYGIDLTNLRTGLTIEDIKIINPYLGIDEFYKMVHILCEIKMKKSFNIIEEN
jgi:hypothetical protein